MRRIVLGAVACLMLSGCTDDVAPAAGAAGTTGSTGTAAATLTLPSASASASTSTAPESSPPSSDAGPTINDRGNVVEKLGQQAGIRTSEGRQAVIFAVDSVEIDPTCSGRNVPATNGHYLGVRVRVTTGDLAFLGGTWSMSEDDFAIQGPDGALRFDVAGKGASNCLPEAERFPATSLQPNRQYVGTIVLDSPVTSGTLVFSTPALQGNGWEWQF